MELQYRWRTRSPRKRKYKRKHLNEWKNHLNNSRAQFANPYVNLIKNFLKGLPCKKSERCIKDKEMHRSTLNPIRKLTSIDWQQTIIEFFLSQDPTKWQIKHTSWNVLSFPPPPSLMKPQRRWSSTLSSKIAHNTQTKNQSPNIG